MASYIYLSNMRITLLLLAIMVSFVACKTSLPTTTAVATKKIETYPGPEDLVLQRVTGGARLIVSCDQRRDGEDLGGFMSVDVKTGKAVPLEVIGLPDEIELHPHGIDMCYNSKGIPYLYAINHQPGPKGTINSVLKFQIKQQHLQFEEQYLDEKLISPNDLAALPDGSIYVTNDSKRSKIGLGWLFEKMFKVRTSKIAYYHAHTGTWSFPADKKLAYANGIIAQANRVVVAATQKKDLVVFDRDVETGTLSVRKNIKEIVGSDNITVVNDSLILIAAHPSSMAFIKHAKKSEKLSPGITWLVNLNSGAVKAVYATDGSEISANSTSLHFNGKLYIAQVFDPFILEVNLKEPIWEQLP